MRRRPRRRGGARGRLDRAVGRGHGDASTDCLDGHIVDRLLSPPLDGQSGTVLEFLGLVSWWDTLPFFVAVLLAGGYAVVAILQRAAPLRRSELAAGLAALLGWVLFFQLTPRVLANAPDDANVEPLLVLALAAAIVAGVVVARLALVRAPGTAASPG